jgi:hypothetical protein
MKVELAALSLALSRASAGIQRTQDPSSGAVLLSASSGLLRASMVSNHRLSFGSCPCEGDIEVAVEAKRLSDLIASCPEGEVELKPKGISLSFLAAETRATLAGYDPILLPRHTRPPDLQTVSIPGELVAKIRTIEKLTGGVAGAWGGGGDEQVVLLLNEGGGTEVVAHYQGMLAARFSGIEVPGSWSSLALNRQLVQALPSGAVDLAWSETHIGFEVDDSGTYEPRIEGVESRVLAFFNKPRPACTGRVEAKSLARAVKGALSVSLTGRVRPIDVQASDGRLVVSCKSDAGDYEANLAADASLSPGRYNAELLLRVCSACAVPAAVVNTRTLWLEEGGLTIALQGMAI